VTLAEWKICNNLLLVQNIRIIFSDNVFVVPYMYYIVTVKTYQYPNITFFFSQLFANSHKVYFTSLCVALVCYGKFKDLSLVFKG
jgi:hypothetical protein